MMNYSGSFMSSASNFIKPLVPGPIIRDESVYRTTISIDPVSSIFEGHFPEFPILPGIVLIDLIHELVTKILDQPVMLSEASNIKFLKSVVPENDNELCIALHISHEENLLKVNANITDPSEKEIFKGQFSYTVG